MSDPADRRATRPSAGGCSTLPHARTSRRRPKGASSNRTPSWNSESRVPSPGCRRLRSIEGAAQTDQQSACFRSGGGFVAAGSFLAGTAVAAGRVRRLVAIGDAVLADDRRLLADRALGAAISFGEPAAELVDRRIRIDANRVGILAHICTRVDADRPAAEVVALEAAQKVGRDLGGRGDLLDRNAFLD